MDHTSLISGPGLIPVQGYIRLVKNLPNSVLFWQKERIGIAADWLGDVERGRMGVTLKVKKNQNISDKPEKFINIDFCQSENSFKSTRFQLVMIRNNRANFSFASYFREPHMAARS